jgi:hypothetical protein
MAGKQKVRVTIAALYHDGRGYITGQELDVDAAEATSLVKSGFVEKVKARPAAKAKQAKAEEEWTETIK